VASVRESLKAIVIVSCAARSMGLWHLVRKRMGNLPKWASGLFIVGGLTVPRAASGLRQFCAASAVLCCSSRRIDRSGGPMTSFREWQFKRKFHTNAYGGPPRVLPSADSRKLPPRSGP